MFSILAPVTISAYVPDNLFRSDEVIKMELRSDFSSIIGDRTEFDEYQDAELIYYEGRKPVKLKVMIMSRGNFRRNPDNCDFPPLFINFKKSEVKNTLFEKQDKLKLSTPCQGEEDLLEEYIVYKMYNKVTDMSLRVRLVKILYFDTGRNKRLFEKYSFFIEDVQSAAARINSSVVEKELTPADIDRENFRKMSVFQYMIGNIDWSISPVKNIIFMQPEESTGNPYAIPHDFDFSVFVSAKYTLMTGVEEDILATRKVFKGLCFTTSELIGIFDFYRKLRPSFESIIDRQKALSYSTRYRLTMFLDDFYTVINNDQLAKQAFLRLCPTGDVKISGGE